MLTPRLERLKKQIINAKPEVYAERVLLVTQAYRETENERPEIQKARAMIRTYFDYGGHHMQFNVVSRKTLLKAQHYPDDYRSLLIRVAGYSDYFVMLSKEVQDDMTNLDALGTFLQSHREGTRLELLPHHRLGESKYERLGRSRGMKDIPTPSKEEIDHAQLCIRSLFLEMGVYCKISHDGFRH